MLADNEEDLLPLEWLLELPEEQAESITAEQPAEIPSSPEMNMEDAAFAWLESLAIKQGATEALLLKPEERLEKPPEWVERAAESAALAGDTAGVFEESEPEFPEPEAPVTQAESVEAELEAETSPQAAQLAAVEEIEETPQDIPPAQAQADLLAMPDMDDADAAFAWLESLAVKQGATEALLLKPEERQEQPPEWVGLVVEGAAAAAAAAAVAGIASSEKADQETTPLDEVLPESADQKEQVADQEGAAEMVSEGGPADLLAVEPPSAAAMSDEDAAFAWLESLAVRQGADEALLLKPEERLEAPPSWVVGAQSQAALDAAEAGDSQFPTLEQTLAEAPEIFKRDSTESEQPGWLETGAEQVEIEPQEQTPAAENTFVDEHPLIQTPPIDKNVPDLPSWLSGAGDASDEMDWTPPPVAQRTYDLNKASLGELERLPGIGFIMAQRILTYREANGPFYALEDMLQIQGFTQGTLEGIQERLFVTLARPAAAQPEGQALSYTLAQAAPPELNDARDALGLGEIELALEKYASLVEAEQFLVYVVKDLEEMVERRPDDIALWQTLGDAYLRSDQIARALEAYTKAEQLLR